MTTNARPIPAVPAVWILTRYGFNDTDLRPAVHVLGAYATARAAREAGRQHAAAIGVAEPVEFYAMPYPDDDPSRCSCWCTATLRAPPTRAYVFQVDRHPVLVAA